MDCNMDSSLFPTWHRIQAQYLGSGENYLHLQYDLKKLVLNFYFYITKWHPFIFETTSTYCLTVLKNQDSGTTRLCFYMHPKASLLSRWHLAFSFFCGIVRCIFFCSFGLLAELLPCSYMTESFIISLPTDKSCCQTLGASCLQLLHSYLSLRELAMPPYLCIHMCAGMRVYESRGTCESEYIYAYKEPKQTTVRMSLEYCLSTFFWSRVSNHLGTCWVFSLV